MADSPAREVFESARVWVSGALFLAGSMAIIGSLLDWVTFVIDDERVLELGARPSSPVSGFDVGDGRWAAAAGVAIIVAAFLLVIRGRGAGLSLLASIVAGAVAIADYRDLTNLTADLASGEPQAGIGLTLVVAAAILGLLASVAGIAATPRREG